MIPNISEYLNEVASIFKGMDMYFSVNNNVEVLRMPYIPPDIEIENPLSYENFETTSGKILTLVGDPGLRSLTIESFFPIKFYKFLGNTLLAPDCIDFFNRNRNAKFRVVISSASININMLCIVTNFKYSKKQNENVRYTLSIQEYIDPNGGI